MSARFEVKPLNDFIYMPWLADSDILPDATAALALQNLNIDALMCRSIALFCSKRMKLSLNDCNEVLRLHPSHADAYFLRSKINLSLNMPSAANEDAKIALNLLPQTRSNYSTNSLLLLTKAFTLVIGDFDNRSLNFLLIC